MTITNKEEFIRTIAKGVCSQFNWTPLEKYCLHLPLFLEEDLIFIESKIFYFLMNTIRDDVIERLIELNTKDATCLKNAAKDIVGCFRVNIEDKSQKVNLLTGEHIAKAGLCEILWRKSQQVLPDKRGIFTKWWPLNKKTIAIETNLLNLTIPMLDELESEIIEWTYLKIYERSQKVQGWLVTDACLNKTKDAGRPKV